ncbi:EF-P 5-aminopentanol modification-associated protein YfmH [Fructilactobacillus carniphilus]|uniref:Insulinase family protein n=1 Tax=Fructilactobacillus carniphilus TaxID=2940297 RepID=A0ABY5C1T0_9LACO|nr:pitrilysin family protein [Fructilactobacillus carniphilus]USS91255.1 insulinase family protein [Fructilactobacillus carniphilus]
MQKHYNQYDETVESTRLANGMKVIVNPKPQFNSIYAMLTADFGSINVRLKNRTVPAGIAHFMEHKLFDKEHYDSSDHYAALGASDNAFTSFAQTSYLFTATDNVIENLRVLLDLVYHPFFSPEKIAKEQGIIGQEILMYQDDPNSRLYFDTIANLYSNSPLSADIAGDIPSIAQITEADLYATYRQYYQPGNLTLTLCGPVTLAEILPVLQTLPTTQGDQAELRRLKQQTKRDIQNSVVIPQRETSLSVTTPKLAVGYRGPAPTRTGRDFAQQELAFGIFLQLLFSEDSDIYQHLYQTGIINDSFGFDFEMEADYHFLILAMDTEQPERFSDAIGNVIEQALQDPQRLAPQFNLIKNEELGERISQMNSVSAIANQLGTALDGYTNLFDEIEIINQLDLKTVVKLAQAFFRASQKTINLIK